jgi:hypothetical protein
MDSRDSDRLYQVGSQPARVLSFVFSSDETYRAFGFAPTEARCMMEIRKQIAFSDVDETPDLRRIEVF